MIIFAENSEKITRNLKEGVQNQYKGYRQKKFKH